MVNMRAIRFKCIYNIILSSHEPECILKWITKSCNQKQMHGALKPKRRWPLSPVSASRALPVCELSRPLGSPGCFESGSSRSEIAHLGDAAG